MIPLRLAMRCAEDAKSDEESSNRSPPQLPSSSLSPSPSSSSLSRTIPRETSILLVGGGGGNGGRAPFCGNGNGSVGEIANVDKEINTKSSSSSGAAAAAAAAAVVADSFSSPTSCRSRINDSLSHYLDAAPAAVGTMATSDIVVVGDDDDDGHPHRGYEKDRHDSVGGVVFGGERDSLGSSSSSSEDDDDSKAAFADIVEGASGYAEPKELKGFIRELRRDLLLDVAAASAMAHDGRDGNHQKKKENESNDVVVANDNDQGSIVLAAAQSDSPAHGRREEEREQYEWGSNGGEAASGWRGASVAASSGRRGEDYSSAHGGDNGDGDGDDDGNGNGNGAKKEGAAERGGQDDAASFHSFPASGHRALAASSPSPPPPPQEPANLIPAPFRTFLSGGRRRRCTMMPVAESSSSSPPCCSSFSSRSFTSSRDTIGRRSSAGAIVSSWARSLSSASSPSAAAAAHPPNGAAATAAASSSTSSGRFAFFDSLPFSKQQQQQQGPVEGTLHDAREAGEVAASTDADAAPPSPSPARFFMEMLNRHNFRPATAAAASAVADKLLDEIDPRPSEIRQMRQQLSELKFQNSLHDQSISSLAYTRDQLADELCRSRDMQLRATMSAHDSSIRIANMREYLDSELAVEISNEKKKIEDGYSAAEELWVQVNEMENIVDRMMRRRRRRMERMKFSEENVEKEEVEPPQQEGTILRAERRDENDIEGSIK